MQPVKQEPAQAHVNEEQNIQPVFDNRVSTITSTVKSESREAEPPRNAVSVVMVPGVAMSREQEAERAVVRSNQQAKIPLKKRELKLSDSYHGNHLNNSSSIIVCNPSVIQSKDSRGNEGKVLAPVAPPGGPATFPQQHQRVANGTEPHRQGHNGVTAQGGVVGHVGVIRSAPEHHRILGSDQQEPNGPSLDLPGCRGAEDEREVSRQSVLVRKETPAAARKTPEGVEVRPDGVSSQSDSTQESQRRAAEEQHLDTGTGPDPIAPHRDHGDTDRGEERETDRGTLGKEDGGSESTAPPLRQPGDGLNGGSAAPPHQPPLEEASSELQKEGIRLKIKIPPHRRNKLRGKGAKEEERGRQEEAEEDKALRRSARICRYVGPNIIRQTSLSLKILTASVFLKPMCFANLQAEFEGR